MPDKNIESRNVLERLGDVFRVLTSQVPLKEARRLGMPELTGISQRQLPGAISRQEQFLRPEEVEAFSAIRGIPPEQLQGVRAQMLPQLFPRRTAGAALDIPLGKKQSDIIYRSVGVDPTGMSILTPRASTAVISARGKEQSHLIQSLRLGVDPLRGGFAPKAIEAVKARGLPVTGRKKLYRSEKEIERDISSGILSLEDGTTTLAEFLRKQAKKRKK